MAPAKNKWIRRFIIPETTRHKKGFTIYKVTSVIFLNSSREQVSKVSVWKRYNDFKKLYSDLSNLHKHLRVKENFPAFPKLKYFDRFRAEVIEERRIYALKFLEFVGRYSYLYSSDTFIKFFETSHMNDSANDCTYSLSSDTSEDDHIDILNDCILTNDIIAQSTFQTESKTSHNVLINSCSALSNTICSDQHKFITSQRKNESCNTINAENTNIKQSCSEQSYRIAKLHTQDTAIVKDCDEYIKNTNFDIMTLSDDQSGTLNNSINKTLPNCDITHSMCSTMLHDRLKLSQTQADSMQYILVAAGHMNAALKHESIAEYREAFTQYKLGISYLISGVQFDPDSTRVSCVKNKISKYLTQAEQLYNEHLNYNISVINKPVSELQNYKILKLMKPVILVLDTRINCRRIIKSIEKSSVDKDNISNYILRRQIPYMVNLYACVETETTVFLILQYASCGRLWDFIRLYYKTSEYLHSNVNPNHHTNSFSLEEHNNSKITHIPDERLTDKIVKSVVPKILVEQNLDRFTSENNLQKMNDSHLNTEAQSKIYNVDIPTTCLLEKSQKLLQSVNATLRRSNSIASRLNDYKESRQSENVSLLNTEIITRTRQNSNLILPTVYHNKSLNDINIDDIINKDLSMKTLTDNVHLKDINHLSKNDGKNLQISQDICEFTMHRSCIIFNSHKNETNGVSYNKSITESRHLISKQGIQTNGNNDNNIVHNYNGNNVGSCFDKINSSIKCCNNTNGNLTSNKDSDIDYVQYPYLCKEINVDEEQEFWQIPEAIIRSWAAEILLSLEALHQQGVLIFDLKPNNILLDDTRHIQLTYIVPQHNMQLLKLGYPYSSPELCIFSPTTFITSATDVWSFGVILYELLTGIPFVAKHPGTFHSHSTINIPNKISENARSLLRGILKYHPDERLRIEEIKRHSFFAKIDWSNVINSQL